MGKNIHLSLSRIPDQSAAGKFIDAPPEAQAIYSAMLNASLDHYNPTGEGPFEDHDTLAVWCMQEDPELIAQKVADKLQQMGYSLTPKASISIPK